MSRNTRSTASRVAARSGSSPKDPIYEWAKAQACGECYFICNYTDKPCEDGWRWDQGGTGLYVFNVVPGEDRKTVLRRMVCVGNIYLNPT